MNYIEIWHLCAGRYVEADGSARRQINPSTTTFVHSLDIFEKYVYWTDADRKSVEKSDRFVGTNASLLRNTLQFGFDIRVWHTSKQPVPSSKSMPFINRDCNNSQSLRSRNDSRSLKSEFRRYSGSCLFPCLFPCSKIAQDKKSSLELLKNFQGRESMTANILCIYIFFYVWSYVCSICDTPMEHCLSSLCLNLFNIIYKIDFKLFSNKQV